MSSSKRKKTESPLTVAELSKEVRVLRDLLDQNDKAHTAMYSRLSKLETKVNNTNEKELAATSQKLQLQYQGVTEALSRKLQQLQGLEHMLDNVITSVQQQVSAAVGMLGAQIMTEEPDESVIITPGGK